MEECDFGILFDTEKTLGFIKPDLVSEGHVEEILQYIKKSKFEIIDSSPITLTKERATQFLNLISDDNSPPPSQKQITHLSSSPIYAFVLAKDNAVKEFRVLTGPSDPSLARKTSPKSLRALYGKDKLQNALHCTNHKTKVDDQIRFFFPNCYVGEFKPSNDLYYQKHLKSAISKALVALCRKRPKPENPLQFLAQQLKQYSKE